jgi:hypothetical protein
MWWDSSSGDCSIETGGRHSVRDESLESGTRSMALGRPGHPSPRRQPCDPRLGWHSQTGALDEAGSLKLLIRPLWPAVCPAAGSSPWGRPLILQMHK